MKTLFSIFLTASVLWSQCVASDVSGCPGNLNSGGDITGTIPLITCPVALYNVAYSTMGNSAARVEDVCFIKSLSNSDTTHCISVAIHGGGFNSGNQHGGFQMAGPAGWFVSMELGDCPTIVSLNYTLFSGGLGTPAPAPAAIQDILCGLHRIGHDAGTVYPGNPNDIRFMNFSIGSQLSMSAAWNAGGYTPVCEFNDAYTIRGPNAVTGVAYDFTAQWNGTYGTGGSGLDSTFAPTIEGEYSCTVTPQNNCPNALIPYDNYAFIGVGKPQFVMLEGATDTITNPTYEGGSAVTQFAALGMPLQRQVTPGEGHGSSCKFVSPFVPTECWKLAVEIERDTKPAVTSGVSVTSGSSLGMF